MKVNLSLIIAGICLASLFCLAPPAALAQPTDTLVVGTYNVESDSDTEPNVVVEDIKRVVQVASPDVWGLAEVPNEDAAKKYAEAANFPGSDFDVILGESGGSDKLAILYNKNRLQQVSPKQELEDIGGDRKPLVGTFKLLPDGPTILAVDNHFNRCDPEKRNKQAENLREWIEGETQPIIALGDYNFDFSVNVEQSFPGGCSSCDSSSSVAEGNAAFKEFTNSPQVKWIKPNCLIDSAVSCPETGTGCSRCFNSILDFVFVAAGAKDWQGKSEIVLPTPGYCANDGSGGADHLPVVATLQIGNQDGASNGQAGLRIVSLLPNPSGDESQNEAATIRNAGSTAVNLTGWKLRDRAQKTWSLDSLGTIAPGQSVEIRRQGQPMALNNSGGDTVELVAPSGEVVDTVTYSSTVEDQTIPFRR